MVRKSFTIGASATALSFGIAGQAVAALTSLALVSELSPDVELPDQFWRKGATSFQSAFYDAGGKYYHAEVGASVYAASAAYNFFLPVTAPIERNWDVKLRLDGPAGAPDSKVYVRSSGEGDIKLAAFALAQSKASVNFDVKVNGNAYGPLSYGFSDQATLLPKPDQHPTYSSGGDIFVGTFPNLTTLNVTGGVTANAEAYGLSIPVPPLGTIPAAASSTVNFSGDRAHGFQFEVYAVPVSAPEPEEYALMLAGAVPLVTWQIRRRRKQPHPSAEAAAV